MNQEKLHNWSHSPGIAVTDEDMWTASSSPLNTFHPPNYLENYGKVSANEGASVNTLQPFQSTAVWGTLPSAYISSDTNMSGGQDVVTTSGNTMGEMNALSYNNVDGTFLPNITASNTGYAHHVNETDHFAPHHNSIFTSVHLQNDDDLQASLFGDISESRHRMNDFNFSSPQQAISTSAVLFRNKSHPTPSAMYMSGRPRQPGTLAGMNTTPPRGNGTHTRHGSRRPGSTLSPITHQKSKKRRKLASRKNTLKKLLSTYLDSPSFKALKRLHDEAMLYGEEFDDSDDNRSTSEISSSFHSFATSDLSDTESQTDVTSISSTPRQKHIGAYSLDGSDAISADEQSQTTSDSKPQYPCTLDGCNKVSHNASEFQRHEKNKGHYNPERYMCVSCLRPDDYLTGNSICQLCDSPFTMHESLEAHYRRCLPTLKTQPTRATFTRSYHATKHLVEKHGYTRVDANGFLPSCIYLLDDGWPRECKICDETFDTFEERNKHILWHYKRGDTWPKSDHGPGNDSDDDDNNDDDHDVGKHSRKKSKPLFRASAKSTTTSRSKSRQNNSTSSSECRQTRDVSPVSSDEHDGFFDGRGDTFKESKLKKEVVKGITSNFFGHFGRAESPATMRSRGSDADSSRLRCKLCPHSSIGHMRDWDQVTIASFDRKQRIFGSSLVEHRSHILTDATEWTGIDSSSSRHRISDGHGISYQMRRFLKEGDGLQPCNLATHGDNEMVTQARTVDQLARGQQRRMTRGISIKEEDEEPVEGDILDGAVSWTRDLMWMLRMKIERIEELNQVLRDCGDTGSGVHLVSQNLADRWKFGNKLHRASVLSTTPSRDHVFLIKGSSSMRPYWDISRVFHTIAHKVKQVDTDGTDLCFTIPVKGLNLPDASRCMPTITSWLISFESLAERKTQGRDTIAVVGILSHLPNDDMSLQQLWHSIIEEFDHPENTNRELPKGRDIVKGLASIDRMFESLLKRILPSTGTEIELSPQRVQFNIQRMSAYTEPSAQQYSTGMLERFNNVAQYSASRRLSGVDNPSLSKRKRASSNGFKPGYVWCTFPKEYVHSWEEEMPNTGKRILRESSTLSNIGDKITTLAVERLDAIRNGTFKIPDTMDCGYTILPFSDYEFLGCQDCTIDFSDYKFRD